MEVIQGNGLGRQDETEKLNGDSSIAYELMFDGSHWVDKMIVVNACRQEAFGRDSGIGGDELYP
jgi:hypothetical protein